MDPLTLSSMFERLEGKLDGIQRELQHLSLSLRETTVTQAAHDREISALKREVSDLKAAHNKALGAISLLTLPGVIVAIITFWGNK